jgi:hypothetical protein
MGGELEAEGDLWAGVDRLIDRAPSLADLRAHRLQHLAARRWRSLGRPLPDDLVHEEHVAAVVALAAPVLLARVREVYDGPAIVVKGPVVAARYPDPALRPFSDLDLIVPDAAELQSALVGAGFREVGNPEIYLDIHHLRPLWSAGLPLVLELHTAPKWIDSLEPPSQEELFSVAVPGTPDLAGALTLPPAHHALVLTTHSWAHEPLRRIRELLDVALVAEEAERRELDDLAHRWNVARPWRTTIAAAEALLLGRQTPLPLRVWARHLPRVRERTVLDTHLRRWLSDFSVLPPRRALRSLTVALARDVKPAAGEGWKTKLSRMGQASRRAFVRRSEHDDRLGDSAAPPRKGK